MRSLPELQAEYERLIGLPPLAQASRENLMDAIRDHLGHADELQIDPMKAFDLKKELDWGTEDPFSRIEEKYLNHKYVVEPKLDGARMRLFIGAGKNRMNTGRRSDKTYAYIERSDNFRHLRDLDIPGHAGTILDGEILAPAASIDTGRVVTQGLLNSSVALVNTNPDDSWAIQERVGAARYHIFDILALDGQDITSMPYILRRPALEKIWETTLLRATTFLVPVALASKTAINEALDAGYEGAMIKSVQGTYQAGKRSRNWLKVKKMSTIDVFIVGSIPGEGRNEGLVGALICAVHDGQGFTMEVAQPGAFTDEFREEISGPDGKVKPEWKGRVLEVMAQEITKNGRLRHPQLIRVRPDKTAQECTTDQLQNFTNVRGVTQ